MKKGEKEGGRGRGDQKEVWWSYLAEAANASLRISSGGMELPRIAKIPHIVIQGVKKRGKVHQREAQRNNKREGRRCESVV